MINDIFQACVDVLYFFADLFGMTYKEINVWFFCVIEPIIFGAVVMYCIRLRSRVQHLQELLKQNINHITIPE